MTGGVQTLEELVEQLLAFFEEHTRRPSIVTGKGTRRQRRHMSPDWQRFCRRAGLYGHLLHGLLIACCKAAGDASFELPIPITEARLAQVQRHLQSGGIETKNRMANYMVALRSLPPDVRAALIGRELQDMLDRPRCPRKYNAEPGTFPRLANDLDIWSTLACGPLETYFDEREPLGRDRAAALARYLLCAATLLLSVGAITADVSLADLVVEEMFDLWLNAHDDHSSDATTGTIGAFIRVRTDLHGDDDTAQHMRRQTTGRRDPHALPPAAVRELSVMLRARRSIELLPFALMSIASLDVTPINTRLKLANVAAAMAAALEYGLKPGDTFSLEHDGDYRVVVPPSMARSSSSPLPQSAELTALFKQRHLIRELLGAVASRAVMVNANGDPMGNQECAQALSRTLKQFGISTFPWQRLWDFVAVRLLLADPKALRSVANLIGFADPALVHKRYAAMIPRRPASKTEQFKDLNSNDGCAV